MKRSLKLSLAAAGLVALAGAAQAQAWTAAGTADVPVQAGEASTMTRGVPNAATTNSPWPDGTPVIVVGSTPVPAVVTTVTPVAVVPAPVIVEPRHDARHRGYASASTNVPGRAGEASTMTHGVPNMATNNPPELATVSVLVPMQQQAVVNPPVYYQLR